jgi:hypothetical protein
MFNASPLHQASYGLARMVLTIEAIALGIATNCFAANAAETVQTKTILL